MFGKPANPYEEVIAKATDSNQTEVSWDIFLTVWDKVNEDGEAGARNCVAALQKRLQHRSANVQLFSLTLAGALVNNCGPSLHREISGKAFTQALVRLINDRTTHDSVRKEALKMVEDWVKEHPGNGDFDLMVETYEQLKRQNHRFSQAQPAEPVNPRSEEAMRREEEELQRALEESAKMADPRRGFVASQPHKALPEQPNGRASSPSNNHGFAPPQRDSSINRDERTPKRVRAIYDFDGGQGPDELPFRKGDVIRVTECVYTDWWKGELRGRVGIFPANRVEAIPEPAAADPSREAEMEAELFAKSASIDKLLTMMRQLSARGEDLADNDELAERYNECMAIAPKVVALIRKYDQKQAELREMHDKFNRAKSTYEQAVGYGDPRYGPPQGASHSGPAAFQQQHQQVGTYGQSYLQHQQQPAYAPSNAAAAAAAVHDADRERRDFEERERREYEAKWAQYERDLAAYNAAQAQLAQQQQQAPAQVPAQVAPQQHLHGVQHDPRGLQPAQSYHAPAPQGSAGETRATSHSPRPVASQPYSAIAPIVQPPPVGAEPVWDGQQWMYPEQHAAVQHQEPRVTSPATNSATAPMTSPSRTALAPASHVPPAQSYPAQPYPATEVAAAPTRGVSPVVNGSATYGISEGMQSMSMGGPTGTAPMASPALVRHQLHDPPVASASTSTNAAISSPPPPMAASAGLPNAQPLYAANVAAAAAGEQRQQYQQQQHQQQQYQQQTQQTPVQNQPQPQQNQDEPSEEDLEEQARREWAEYERKKAEYDAYIASQGGQVPPAA